MNEAPTKHLAEIDRRPQVKNLLRGFLIGAADIVPGVSGGTVALLLNIYGRLVAAVSRFDLTALRLLKQREFMRFIHHVDLIFLGTVLAGIACGVVSLASVMHYLVEEHTQHTYSVFFGLVLASVFIVARMVKPWTPRRALLFVFGALFAYQLVGLPLLQSPPEGNWYMFLSGMIAICATALPGISGSFVLLILGKYAEITGLLRGLLGGDFSLETLTTLTVFCLGCGIGLLGFCKVLKWLLTRFEATTISLLCGVLLGSLRSIWPFQESNLQGADQPAWVLFGSLDAFWSIAFGAIALFLVLFLDHVAKASRPDSILANPTVQQNHRTMAK